MGILKADMGFELDKLMSLPHPGVLLEDSENLIRRKPGTPEGDVNFLENGEGFGVVKDRVGRYRVLGEAAAAIVTQAGEWWGKIARWSLTVRGLQPK